MVLAPPIVIERLARVSPIGLRFWDPVSEKPIGDGLVVTAFPPDQPWRRTEAFVNNSSVYVLKDLPGLRDAENGSGDARFWREPPVRRPLTVEVKDDAGRFQPFRMNVTAPSRGVLLLDDEESPPGSAEGAPLFSSSSRQVPSGMAVIRAELREPLDGRPAAWALVEARHEGRLLSRGLSDEKGRIALIFAYPEPQRDPMVSPPGSALADQEWSIQLTAAYEPPAVARTIPDLTHVLSQAPATIWRKWGDASRRELLDSAQLRFGQELVLRSIDPGANLEMSVLLIAPAGSPP
jgi:hypothetical protein